jgi:hypothetical protein
MQASKRFVNFFQVRTLLSQLQKGSSDTAAPIIVHPQAHHLLANMQVRNLFFDSSITATASHLF